MNTDNTQPQQDVSLTDEGKTTPAPQDDDNDFPLGQACDLSGEGTCEACQ
jgi:hypothetical protein